MTTPRLVAVGVAAVALGSLAVSPALAATTPSVPFVRALSIGKNGQGVYTLQRALINAHVRPAFLKPTTHFGVKTRYEVQRFQRLNHIEPTGIVGRPTKAKLWKFYTPYGRTLDTRAAKWHAHMLAVARARAQAIANLHNTRVRKVMEAVHRSQAMSGYMAYSQGWSRTNLPAFPNVPRATDCSGYAIWVLRHAGIPVPMGWTGTLGVEGWRVYASPSAMHVGDLVLYDRYPHGHVEVYIGGGMTAGHGSAGIHIHRWNYRYVGQVRRFFK